MPFESQWARIPLSIRWGVSIGIGVVIVVLLILFVTHNDGNGEVQLNSKGLRAQAKIDLTLMQQDQAPHTVHVGSAGKAEAALVAGVRKEMQHRIFTTNVDGPLEWVRCGRAGASGDRISYHCIARSDEINYPFLAIVAHHTATFCKRDYPAVPSQNVPVSERCQL